MTANLSGVVPMSWADLDASIRAENTGLPVTIGERTVLSNMTLDASDESLTYWFQFDYPTLNDETFDLVAAKEGVLEGCEDMKPLLTGPVKIVIQKYKANDGSVAEFKIYPDDCGY